MKINKQNCTIVFVIYLIIIYSCSSKDSTSKIAYLSSKQENSTYTTTVNIPQNLDSLTFDYNKQLTDIKYVKLETTDKCLIGNINKLLVTETGFVIADYYIANAVFFFDSTGRFLNKIASGDSPDSPENIKDIAYNDKTDILYMYDAQQSTTYCYSGNGHFLRKNIINNVFCNRIACLDDSLILFYSPAQKSIGGLNNYELAIGDSVGNIKYTVFENFKEILTDYDYNHNIATYGNNTFYSQKFSKYIFQITKNPVEIFPRFKLNFQGKNSIVDKVTPATTVEDIKQLLQANNYNFDGQILPVNNTFYFGCYKKFANLGIFYSAETGNILGGNIASKTEIQDTIKVEYYTYPIAASGNQFISIMNPGTIVKSEQAFEKSRKLMHIPPPLREKQLSKILEAMDENDNPVLMLYKIKHF